MVSAAVQKAGGVLVHPIDSTKGSATKRGWPGRVGKMTASLGMSVGLIFSR